MHKWLMLLLTPIGLATAPARSEVLAADADAACALLIQPARWWKGQHSYSGDAANMRIDARAGGCFCEAIVDMAASRTAALSMVVSFTPRPDGNCALWARLGRCKPKR